MSRPWWLRHLPNALTASRLAAIPIIALLVAADDATSLSGGWLFAAVAVTDFLDGYLARRLGVVSRFGQVADPLCDRLLIGVGLIALLMLGRVHPALPLILLARDVLAMGTYVLAARLGANPRVSLLGKVSSALAMVAVAFAIGYSFWWTEPLLVLASAFALASLTHYIVHLCRVLPSLRRPKGGMQ